MITKERLRVAGFNIAANGTPITTSCGDADATYAGLHFLSNGFRPLGTLNGGTTIYSFAMSPI